MENGLVSIMPCVMYFDKFFRIIEAQILDPFRFTFIIRDCERSAGHQIVSKQQIIPMSSSGKFVFLIRFVLQVLHPLRMARHCIPLRRDRAVQGERIYLRRAVRSVVSRPDGKGLGYDMLSYANHENEET